MSTGPIRASITVNRTAEDAFRIFTEELGTWWPFAGYSIGEQKVATAIVEARAGGRVFERWHDGTECEWATIIAWDPPKRFVMDWNPNPERTITTEVEVRFIARGDATDVEVEHRAWERLADVAPGLRDGYAKGWPFVLDLYAKATVA